MAGRLALEERVDDLLTAGMRARPAAPALVHGGDAVSFADLGESAARLAATLVELAGPAPLTGQRVLVIGPNLPSTVAGMLAVWRAGAVAVPLSARLREYELRRVLADAEPLAAVAIRAWGGYSFEAVLPGLAAEAPSLRGAVLVDERGPVGTQAQDGQRSEPDPVAADVGAVLYTSGTSGEPKGALVGHATLAALGAGMTAPIELAAGDVSTIVVPVTHAFGLGCLLASLTGGGQAVLVDSTAALRPLADELARRECLLHGPPALFARLLKAGALGRVRGGFVAGAPSPPDLLQRLDGAGAQVLNLYGMTEIGAASSCRLDDPPEARYQTVGRPLPGYKVRADPDGELQVRGPYVTRGYHRRPDATAAAFDGEWFRTGDLGSIDAAGRVRISGRAKEVVMVGGLNVFPAEVEGLLTTHPDVVEAVAVPVPHAQMGEALEAFVLARAGSGIDAPRLRAYARSRIAGYKVPQEIHFVDELPQLASGKPDRGELARMARG
jgi:acyl-CoA synthetase (AMP-forming)/AMP-acid ligase II